MDEKQGGERRPYRLTRRQFLAASSAAAAVAACGPAATPRPTGAATSTAAATASAGPALKIGQLLPFSKVYAELGASMQRATNLYLEQKGNVLANRRLPSSRDEANDPVVGTRRREIMTRTASDVMRGIVATR